MHAMGWSREKAVNFMLDNTAMSRDSVEAEIDRYITWPGQACAYKIGERKIKDLRTAAAAQIGDKFEVAEFHRAVLKCVGPMSALETCIERFVENVRSGKRREGSGQSGMASPVVQGGSGGVVNNAIGWEMVWALGIVRLVNLL